ncbi:MAG: site-specific DNA-methyltransferase [Fermentimonas sp.]|nr:site-specific DNA-methyltransferase [Fermentimonas sp.]
MEKLKQETPDLIQHNIDRIAELFPSAITETKDTDGKLKKAINFTVLKQLLSNDVVDGDECYEFTWVGKKQSIIEGNRPIRKTLRPAKEESKNWDTTENLYIEGDNLEVLKLLQNSYMNSIKMIYIDPPYNTGNDFVYRDDFAVSRVDYEEELGVYDENENRLFKNTDTNGCFHSDWCSMIYPRLQLARNLLTEDGVIFISIDDNEVDNLRKICDEIFGEGNHQATVSYVRKTSGKQDSTNFMKSTEFIMCYSKSKDWDCAPIIASDKVIDRYNKADDSGRLFRETDLRKTGNSDRREDRPLMWYPFYFNPKTNKLLVEKQSNSSLIKEGYIEILPLKPDGSEGRWRWGFQNSLDNLSNLVARIMPKYKSENKYTVYEIDYIDKKGDVRTVKEHTSWDRKEFNSDNAMLEFKNLGFSNQLFPFPKSSALIKHMIYLSNDENSIILDFFSGSATSADAVMQLNAEDKGHRKFIMVQLPEPTDEKSEAYKAGYKNICEIGKERIRRAGNLIEKEQKSKSNKGELFDDKEYATLDTGFRVLKLDTTNMKDVYYSADDYSQQLLLDLESNIKDDRNDLDLLYGVLLDWGVPLSLSHITEIIDGKKVHFVNETDLVACFEEEVNEEIIREIAKRKPLRVVFRDSCFGSSPEKINVSEIFKTLSPDTTIKVI